MAERIANLAKQITSKMADKSNIHLYTAQTPNGIKVSIVLEELGLNYEVSWLHAHLSVLLTNNPYCKKIKEVRTSLV